LVVPFRPQLITIPISHYGERARWALDRSSVEYEEHHQLQIFSSVAALRRGGHKTLPILVTEAQVLTDSEQIVRWASDRGAALFPEDAGEAREVARLSTRFADVFGVETRRFAYECLFGAGERSLVYNEGRAPVVQTVLLRRGFWLVKRLAVAYLGVRPADVARAIGTIDRVFDEVAERLGDGRTYLAGEHFSAADLTFAAMAAPCVFPDRYGVTLPTVDEVPAAGRAKVLAWRAHPAGQFALKVYEARPPPRGRFARPLRAPPRAAGFPA
jgi:glutathione S-transferase